MYITRVKYAISRGRCHGRPRDDTPIPLERVAATMSVKFEVITIIERCTTTTAVWQSLIGGWVYWSGTERLLGILYRFATCDQRWTQY